MTESEIIRYNEDGSPLYADWDSPESLKTVLEEMPPNPPSETEAADTRARREASDWTAEKRARIEARLEALNVAAERQKELLDMPTATLISGVERWYSAAETARFFGRTNQWIYDRMRLEKFRYKDGTLITPVIAENGWIRFNLDLVREIALSCYRSGTVKLPELQIILRRIAQAEVGEAVFDPEEEG
jgi:hypothetical protein